MPGELGHVARWQEECTDYLDALASRHKNAKCPYKEGALRNQDHVLFKVGSTELEAGA